MRKIKILLLLILLLGFTHYSFAQEPKAVSRGIWVTVFSTKKVLYSQESIVELINSCKKSKINEIYLQLFQSGKAFYRSSICDHSKYDEMLKSCGTDPIVFLIKKARENNIKVFAWVNLLSLGQNMQADIIKKFGPDVLTRDQYLRPSGRKNPDESDKYYLREDQLFLEPGDPYVGRYLVNITEEILDKYPSLDGIHLDYARYPLTVPFSPGSKFGKFGLNYGFGKRSVERFKNFADFNPLSGFNSDEKSFKWDNWKREQVTLLVKRISKHVKEKSRDYRVSCAVLPYAERAYLCVSQDWPIWLEQGIVDYVVLMSYSKDNQLIKETVKASLALKDKQKIFVGIGLFLLKDNPSSFKEQYKIIKGLNPDGIVFFSYDDISDESLPE